MILSNYRSTAKHLCWVGLIGLSWVCVASLAATPPQQINIAHEPSSLAQRQKHANHAKHSLSSRNKSKQIVTETGPTFKPSAELMALAQEIAVDNNLPVDWVKAQLLRAKSLSKIKQLVLPASLGTKKNWASYRARFLGDSRIQGGCDFALRNWTYLEKVQANYQVPWEIVVAIIGIETFYGKNMGQFKALDVLTSLSMDFPPSHPRAKERETFFRQELGALLKLMNTTQQQVWFSSFAGAMGLPQFMPSNWHKFAVDFDGDGRIDLNNSQADAIGSVGNYLAKFGWQANAATHFELDPNFDKTHLEEMLLPDILPSFKSEQLQKWGLSLTPNAQMHLGPLALVMLENGENEPTYVLGTENFYTITRYNWSSYYALAVIELAKEIKSSLGR
jgi:membrane-bound lytic murein transglycosylase B